MKTLNDILEANVRTISIDGVDIYYCANDILDVLGYKSSRDRWLHLKRNINHVYIGWFNLKNNRVYKLPFLLASELPKLFSLCNLPKAAELAEKLGHTVFTFKSYIENDTIGVILKAFRDEEMITQYFIDGYRIDLYFPQYNLAVECDEAYHDNQKRKDKSRQNYITNLIGCKWVRYSPEESNFNIGDVIYQIINHIK